MTRVELHDAYLATDYEVTTPEGIVTLRADGPPVGDPRAMAVIAGRRITVVTAWNPRSVAQSPDVNAAANARLRADLQARGWTFWDAVGRSRPVSGGGDPATVAWFEDSFAVVDVDPDQVRQLAHTYGQIAVCVWDGERGSVAWCDE
jgi:hypothetical protein